MDGVVGRFDNVENSIIDSRIIKGRRESFVSCSCYQESLFFFLFFFIGVLVVFFTRLHDISLIL